MARKTTISKEMILDAALKMLVRDGYQAINIKSLAAETGCSTQPIAWHFKNMEGLRKALAVYAREYARRRAAADNCSAAEKFENMGRAFIDMAINESNLFRFLYLGEAPMTRPLTAEDMYDVKDSTLAEGIALQTGLTEKQALSCIRNTVIYSHGIAAMIATGVLGISADEAMRMIKSASEGFVAVERMCRQ